MRWLVGVMVTVAALQTASAKPRLRDMDLFEAGPPPEPCGTGKTWPIVERCLAKLGTVAEVYKDNHVKLVSVTVRGANGLARLHLYAKTETGWLRTSFVGMTNSASQLTLAEAFTSPTGAGVRIDMASSRRSSVALGDGSTMHAVVRQTVSSVCVPSTWQCVSMMTSCEAYVRGRVMFAFFGKPVWHESLGLRLQGNPSTAGSVCMPPQRALMLEEPE